MAEWTWNDSIERWWNAYKLKMLQFVGGLVMEKNDDGKYIASLGRIAFWAVLIPALHIWIAGRGMLEDGSPVKDISPNHLTLLLSLLAYNTTKKVADTVNRMVSKNTIKEPSLPVDSDGPG